ncbi:MAG TPA: 30S ribosomal protein S6 [bacterium]|nr:30S ribosomal protein S6 [bacterium]
MANYEIVAVLRPDLEDDAIEAAVGRIHQRITEQGGTVASTDRWGKRRLAYAVQKYRDGYYLFSVFSLESPQVARLRQTLGLNEDLLRFVVADHHPAPPRPAAPAAAGHTAAAPPAAAPATAPSASAPAPVPAAPASTGSESSGPGRGENNV